MACKHCEDFSFDQLYHLYENGIEYEVFRMGLHLYFRISRELKDGVHEEEIYVDIIHCPYCGERLGDD